MSNQKITNSWNNLVNLVNVKDLKIIENEAYISEYERRIEEMEQEILQANEQLEEGKCQNAELKEIANILKISYVKDKETIPVQSVVYKRSKERLEDIKKEKNDLEKSLKDSYHEKLTEYNAVRAEFLEAIPECKLYKEKCRVITKCEFEKKLLEQEIADTKAKINLKTGIQRRLFNTSVVQFVKQVQNYHVLNELEAVTAAGNELLQNYERKMIENERRIISQVLTKPMFNIPNANIQANLAKNTATLPPESTPQESPLVAENRLWKQFKENELELQNICSLISSKENECSSISTSSHIPCKRRTETITKEETATEGKKNITVLEEFLIKTPKSTPTSCDGLKSKQTNTTDDKRSCQTQLIGKSGGFGKIQDEKLCDFGDVKNVRFGGIQAGTPKKDVPDQRTSNPYTILKRPLETNAVQPMNSQPRDQFTFGKEFLDNRPMKTNQTEMQENTVDGADVKNVGFGSAQTETHKKDMPDQPMANPNVKRPFELDVTATNKKSHLDQIKDQFMVNKEFLDSRLKRRRFSQTDISSVKKKMPLLNQEVDNCLSQPVLSPRVISPFFQENIQCDNDIVKVDNATKENTKSAISSNTRNMGIPGFDLPMFNRSAAYEMQPDDQPWNTNRGQDFDNPGPFDDFQMCFSPPPSTEEHEVGDNPFNKFSSCDRNYSDKKSYF